MYLEKMSYLCGGFVYAYIRMAMSNQHRIGRNMARVMCLIMCVLAPFFSYAQAQYVSLGTSVSNALAVADTVDATVADGAENYFKIEAEHLPATVCYFPDSAFGPIPELISYIESDTLPAVMVSENCRMGWKWELTVVETEEETQPVRYFYFSAHENNAIAQIRPTRCRSYDITLPDTTVCSGDFWEGYVLVDTTIFDSGTYTRYGKTVMGCDSIVTQTVTVAFETYGVDDVTAYDSCVWNGRTHYASTGGPITYETNAAGCDSVISHHLTIRHLVTDTLRATVCDGQLPYLWQCMTISEGGVYSTDTVLGTTAVNRVYMDTVHALVLTVGQSLTADTTAELCAESFEWHGQTYTTSGDYEYNGQTVAGCDSIVTLHLTLKAASASEETRTAYDSYEWHGEVYTVSGDYTYTTTNAVGCDSVITLHLTIKESPVYVYDTTYFCPGINTAHDEPLNETQAIRYLPYVYEAPAEWYKEGVLVDEQPHGMMLNLSRAEENLREYYVGNLEPVEQIAWSYRAHKTASYAPVYAEQEPQWFGTGDLMLNVYFLCGHEYRELLSIGSTEGLDQSAISNQSSVRKVLRDGQIYILRGNAKYTIFGTRIE